MTSPDNVLPPSTPAPSAGSDVLTERATPQATVLSTVWEGPAEAEAEAAEHPDAGSPDIVPYGIGGRSPIVGWLRAPASRRRVLLVTAVAAVICGMLAVGELSDSPVSPAVDEQASADATQGSLSSRAVATGDRAVDASGDDQISTESRRAPREAVSADERLRLVVDPVDSATGGWMLDAQMTDAGGQAAIVRFTVNGVVVEAVDRAPYRLLLNPDLLATLPNAVGEDQPLIVTASAIWANEGDAASLATVVLPN